MKMKRVITDGRTDGRTHRWREICMFRVRVSCNNSRSMFSSQLVRIFIFMSSFRILVNYFSAFLDMITCMRFFTR